MDSYREMKRVYCRVYDHNTGSGLLPNHKFAEKLTKQAVKRIKSFGIDCVEEPVPEGRGAGGVGATWDIIKELWEVKDLLGMLLTLLKTIVGWVRRPSEKYYVKSKPTMSISITVQKVSAEDWHGDTSIILMDLKHLSQDVSLWLKEQYPMYSFDQHIRLSLHSDSYRVSVYQESAKTSAFNNGRLLRRLRALKHSNNSDVYITFSKLLFLKQSVNPVTSDGFSWIGEVKRKNYYSVISAKLFTRYPKPSKPKVTAPAK